MILLVGLGNPGPQYNCTRHNIGFMAIDKIVENYNFSAGRAKFNSFLYESIIDSKKVIAIKPMSYMNNSGQVVAGIKNFYKIPLTNVIIIHDDIDLALGKIKVKVGGSSGGHNGIKSLDNHLGIEYIRVRVGIGRPMFQTQVSDYVLAKFNGHELETITPLLDKISANLQYILNQDLDGFISNINEI